VLAGTASVNGVSALAASKQQRRIAAAAPTQVDSSCACLQEGDTAVTAAGAWHGLGSALVEDAQQRQQQMQLTLTAPVLCKLATFLGSFWQQWRGGCTWHDINGAAGS
jgi:hypothetical protein